jgi:hypothetical protein
MKGKKDFDFFDKPASLRRLWIMLYAFCGLTLVPDFFAHRAPPRVLLLCGPDPLLEAGRALPEKERGLL